METDGAAKEVEHEERDLANYLSPFSLVTSDFFLLFPHLDQDVHSLPVNLNVSTRLNAPRTEGTLVLVTSKVQKEKENFSQFLYCSCRLHVRRSHLAAKDIQFDLSLIFCFLLVSSSSVLVSVASASLSLRKLVGHNPADEILKPSVCQDRRHKHQS